MTGSAAQARACDEDAGAPPAFDMNWDQLDWARINEEVTRLQARIAKATQAGRWNKVQALQHLLTPGGHPNSPTHGHLKFPHPDRASMRR